MLMFIIVTFHCHLLAHSLIENGSAIDHQRTVTAFWPCIWVSYKTKGSTVVSWWPILSSFYWFGADDVMRRHVFTKRKCGSHCFILHKTQSFEFTVLIFYRRCQYYTSMTMSVFSPGLIKETLSVSLLCKRLRLRNISKYDVPRVAHHGLLWIPIVGTTW